MDERVESKAATVGSCSPGATPQSLFSYPLHLSPPGLALMYFSEHVWGANCLLGGGRSDYELLRASGYWVHNLGALQSIEMREVREDEESAADCWLGSRVGGPIRWRKPGGWRLCGKEDIQMHRALLMGEWKEDGLETAWWQRGGHGAANKSRFMKSGDEVRMGRWELGNREFDCRGSENQG